MPVEFLTPPKASVEMLRAAITGRVSRTASTLDLSPPQHSHALPVFDFGVQDIVDGKGMDAARQVSWRYLFFTPDEPVMGAEVNCKYPAETHVFSLFNHGRCNAGTLAALEMAHMRKEVRRATYQLAALRIPTLGLFAIWLRHVAGGPDLLIPVQPAPSIVNAGHCYQVADLFELLQESAGRALEFATRRWPR